ncbi:MAG: SDR family oxidoreductase [Aquabacterium sp.]
MIVITGATGNVGQHVVDQLAAQGLPLRALSRRPVRNEQRPNVQWMSADVDDGKSLATALQGAERLVLITPAHRHMEAHQLAIIEAALRAGVKKIAKLSGLGAGPAAVMRLPQKHHAIEQAIIETGLDHSFVRPNLFMQVLLGSAPSIQRDGAIYAPAGDGRISFTDARDVARVLAAEVQREGRSIVEITGPQALRYADVAHILGELLGRPIRHVDVTPEQARASMLSMGMDAWLIEAFLELFAAYRAGQGAAVLAESIMAGTGAPATSLARFLSDHKGVFAQAA